MYNISFYPVILIIKIEISWNSFLILLHFTCFQIKLCIVNKQKSKGSAHKYKYQRHSTETCKFTDLGLARYATYITAGLE